MSGTIFRPGSLPGGASIYCSAPGELVSDYEEALRLSSSTARARSVGWLLVAVFVSYVCLLQGLTAVGLIGPDEPRYAAISKAMAETGDWVTPRLDGEPWLEKPILFYWASAIAHRLVGDSELAVRIPSALAAVATSLALGWLGWRLYGATTAAVVLLLFPSTVSAFAFARGATTDMLFAASLTLAMTAAVRLVVVPGDRRYVWQAAFGCAVGMAVLAKGPAGVILAGGSLGLWGVASCRTARLTALVQPWVVVSLCAVALPWYTLSAIRNPEFIEVFLISHNIGRFLTPVFRHEQPFWFFGPILAIGLVPWSAFLVAGIRKAVRAWRAGELAGSPSLYLACWVVFPVFFFSLSRSKLPGYVLPAIPGAALLLARTVAGFLDGSERDARWPLFGTAAVLAALAAAFAVPNVAIADVPGLPLEMLRPLAAVIGLVSLVVAGLTYWRKNHAAVAAVALGFAMIVAYLNVSMMPRLDPLISPRHIAYRLQEMGEADRVEVYRLHRGWHYGLNYYLDRRLQEWVPGSTSLVVTTEDGVEDLKARAVPVTVLNRVSAEAVLIAVSSPSSRLGSSPRRFRH